MDRLSLCRPALHNCVHRTACYRICPIMSGQGFSMANSRLTVNLGQENSAVHTRLQPALGTTVGKLDSMPNFRFVCGSLARSVNKPSLFRSSKPDFLTAADLSTLKYQLGIKCIVDCRAPKEYKTAKSGRLVDGEYQLYSVNLPAGRNYRYDEPVRVHPISRRQGNYATDTSPSRHYLINFYTLYFRFRVFCKAPWYLQLWSLVVLLYDYIMSTGNKYFIRMFVTRVLNPPGILQQYKDMVDFSQSGICAALKLLSQEDNKTILLNCAHGKDRTGIVCALVLYCQGISIDEIATDYAMSEAGLDSCRDRLEKEIMEDMHLSGDFLTAKYENMVQLLSYVKEKYGSIQSYLNYIGFGPREQEQLRLKFQAT